MSGTHIAAFTRSGTALAARLAELLGAQAWAPPQYAADFPTVTPRTEPIGRWTQSHFSGSDALIFVSACGIAVRAIAPFLRDKAHDPAVVCLDDLGRNVVSLLSGHLGGANELALHIAQLTGGRPVVTTATDIRGVTAVDVWAKEHDCAIENIGAVKSVSGAVLNGDRVGVAVTEQICPAPWPVTLWLRPRVLVLGVGCKKNTPLEALRDAASDFLHGAGVSARSLHALASIDLKAHELGLLALAQELGVPLLTWPAQDLAAVPGQFCHSERVLAVTGVDNVCERAAVLGASGGPLLRSKTLYAGITLALARTAPLARKHAAAK